MEKIKDILAAAIRHSVLTSTPYIPQIKRTRIPETPIIPKSVEEFTKIVNEAPISILYDIGFELFSECRRLSEIGVHLTEQGKDPDTFGIFLFPSEWYNIIPEEFTVIDIDGCISKFNKAQNSNSSRYGCLAYGIIKSLA